MDDDSSTIEWAAWQIGAALEPLLIPLGSEDAIKAIVREELGIDVPEAMQALGIDAAAIGGVITGLDALSEALSVDEPDRATVALRGAELAAAVAFAANNLADVGARAATGLDPAFITASRIVEELPRRLLDWIVVRHIEETSLSTLHALRVLGIVEVEEVAADPETFTTLHVRRAIKLDRLTALLTDPARWLELAYGWGTDHPSIEKLLERLFYFAVSLGVPASLHFADLHRAHTLAGPTALNPEEDDAPPELRLPLLSAETTEAAFEAGLGLVVLPAKGAFKQGLALLPFADGTLEKEIPLDQLDTWKLVVGSGVDLRAGVGVTARPGEGPGERLKFVTDIDGTGAAASGVIEIRLTRAADAEPLTVFTFGGNSGLFVTGIETRAAALFDSSTPSEVVLEAGVKGALLRVQMDEGDGFLRSIVPDLDVTFDAGFGLSSRRGAYFIGGAALEIARAVDRRIGPVQIRRLALALRPPKANDPPGMDALIGLGVALSIGPVTGVVEGIGARIAIRQRTGGNLGPIDLDIAFKPPVSVGLEIAAGALNGGGFLFFDPANSQYAGAMELHGFGLTVKAVGVLTTKLPGKSSGFSLLVVISAEFTPVQLGLGFRLEGVGGLVGINRTVSVEALRSGLKTGALSSVLSPPDPVRNAAQLISSLNTLFPPANGRHVFGPTARITWGTPTLITIDLCLALEVPSPVRLIVLGRLRALLPDARAPIVQLQMDMVGVVDLDREEASVDATLVDSRLAEFALTGDMALRLGWGNKPAFLLAVGGFHPRFNAPAGFPALARVAVALATGNNPRLRLEAYLALTSNTVQFGARLDLLVKSGRFSLVGFLSFDALVTISPFSFEVDIAGKLAVKAGSSTILSISLSLTLSGPQPWHARGKASFSILFFDVSFHFDVTIGDRRPPPRPASIDVAAPLRAALNDARAWSAQLPAGGETLVTLRTITSKDVLAHPLGALQVRQRVAPLDRTLDRFGANVPSGARKFRITGATVGGVSVATPGVDDLFAPGEFFAMTDEQKISSPSFQAMPSGATIGTPTIAHGSAVAVEIVYEQRLVTAPGVTPPAPASAGLPDNIFAILTVPREPALIGVFTMPGLS